ncbi:MAG: nuclear transport factor 2 family protein [Arenimonas sp.]
MSINPVGKWHEIVRTKDIVALESLLAEKVVFHSPVVHSPQPGRAITLKYLAAAFQAIFNESFRYVREIVGERDAALEFEVEIDGIRVNGVDLIAWNEAGEIVDFKVMVRPLKAINLVHQKMAEMLQVGR